LSFAIHVYSVFHPWSIELLWGVARFGLLWRGDEAFAGKRMKTIHG